MPAPIFNLLKQFVPHNRVRILHNSPHWLQCSAARHGTIPSSSEQRAKNNLREWKDKKKEILMNIGPIVLQTKDMLHSERYMDGDGLTVEDEKMVVEKLLPYHPKFEDKIGCGIESIMVDHHPEFRHSRCLFVVRIDGIRIDFSYHDCLRKYVRDKYPTHAERFIQERFTRRKIRI